MRAQARAKSSYFVKQYQQRQGLIMRYDLIEAFQNPESAEAQQLLNSINRQTAQLRGTRPYWYRKRQELESYAYNLGCPGALLHSARQTCTGGASINICPSIKTGKSCLSNNVWACLANFSGTTRILQPGTFTSGLVYSEISFSSRNSTSLIFGTGMNGRVVGVAIATAYSGWTVRLVLTSKMSMYVREFARIWRFHVTAFNPEPARVQQQGEGNPLAVNPLQHPLTF